MYAEETIVAVATPRGPGGIGIVRLSGADASAVASRVFRSRKRVSSPRSHRMYHGAVIDADGAVIDEALAVFMRAPRSYTGEDVVEIHCHGSPVVLRAVLAGCCHAGARLAEPGEFTKRAFLNQRIDLVQAEAVAEIVSARTEAAARAGVRHLGGVLSQELDRLREQLVGVKAQAEALIDFAEEEIDLDPQALVQGLDAPAEQIAALLSSFRVGRLLRDGFHVAIVGCPNVGKSSLLNRLLGTERAIVTDVPGTTRDILEEGIEIGGVPLVLSDTAGLRAGADSVESIGIERARERARSGDGIIAVLDRSRPRTDDDEDVLASTREFPGVVAVNKCDLPAAWDAADLRDPGGRPVVEICAKTGDGLTALTACLADLYDAGEFDTGAPVVTLVRHRDLLQKAAAAVQQARVGLASGTAVDVVAVDIQAALEHVGAITGAVTTDEVLDRIFREFCIGK